jgi:hypothetical protein
MNDADRLKLLHGRYRPRKCRVGRYVRCRVRGKIKVRSFSDAPIPWPIAGGKIKWQAIVCGSLVKAICLESEIAVAHHWGISPQTVWA